MKKKFTLLLILWPLLVLGGFGLGCGGDTGEPEIMPCDSDSDCPAGYICGVSETCIELFIFDDEDCLDGEEDCLVD